METFNKIWAMIMPYFTVASLQAFMTAVGVAVVKGIIGKKFTETDMTKLFDKAFKTVVEHLSSVTLKQDIQPLVNSKLQEIEEKFNADSKRELAEVREAFKQEIMLLHSFMGYFDNSVGIPEEKKVEANEIYNNAMELLDKKPLEAVTTIAIEEKPKKEKKPVSVNIER